MTHISILDVVPHNSLVKLIQGLCETRGHSHFIFCLCPFIFGKTVIYIIPALEYFRYI